MKQHIIQLKLSDSEYADLVASAEQNTRSPTKHVFHLVRQDSAPLVAARVLSAEITAKQELAEAAAAKKQELVAQQRATIAAQRAQQKAEAAATKQAAKPKPKKEYDDMTWDEKAESRRQHNEAAEIQEARTGIPGSRKYVLYMHQNLIKAVAAVSQSTPVNGAYILFWHNIGLLHEYGPPPDSVYQDVLDLLPEEQARVVAAEVIKLYEAGAAPDILRSFI